VILLSEPLAVAGVLPPAACAWLANAALGISVVWFFHRMVFRA
jgi:hypothetical protein